MTEPLTLFDSIQDILGNFKFIYDEERETATFDVHLMLLDPSDGCYHAYLGSRRGINSRESPADSRRDDSQDTAHRGRRTAAFDDITKVTQAISALRLDNSAMLPKLVSWISDNVHKDERGISELATGVILGEAQVPSDIDAGDFRQLCSIMLSSLPSHPTWDACGYHRQLFTESAGTMAWSFDSSSGRLFVYPTKNLPAPAADPHSVLSRFCDTGDERNLSSIKVRHKVYKPDFLVEDCRYEEREAYEAYHGPYDLIRESAFQGAWTNFLARGVYLCSGLFGGVAFVPVEREVHWNELSDAAGGWRDELHRDLAPAVEKLWLAEFGRRTYRRVRDVREPMEALTAFCREINFLLPIEQCLLVVGEREQFFDWQPGLTPVRVFEPIVGCDTQIRNLRQISSQYARLDNEHLAFRIEAKFRNENVLFCIVTREQGELWQREDHLRRYLTIRKHTLLYKLRAMEQEQHAIAELQKFEIERQFAHMVLGGLAVVSADDNRSKLTPSSRFWVEKLGVIAQGWLNGEVVPVGAARCVQWEEAVEAGLRAARKRVEIRSSVDDKPMSMGLTPEADRELRRRVVTRQRSGEFLQAGQIRFESQAVVSRWFGVAEWILAAAVEQAAYHAFLSTCEEVDELTSDGRECLSISAQRKEDRIVIEVGNVAIKGSTKDHEGNDYKILRRMVELLPGGQLNREWKANRCLMRLTFQASEVVS